MTKPFHEVCREALSRRYEESEILFQQLPLPLPRDAAESILHIPKETLELAVEAAFETIAFRVPRVFLGDISRLATRAGRDTLESFVLESLLRNYQTADKGVFPMCQDTGTACVYSWRGTQIAVDSEKPDYVIFSSAAEKAWKHLRLRNSQLLPLAEFAEANSGNNLPILLESFSSHGKAWDIVVTAKGGGSSNKSALLQRTKSDLNQDGIKKIFSEYLSTLGVSACPPYTVGIAIGGQSAEESMLAAKLASGEMLDNIGEEPISPFRDHGLEALFMELAEQSHWGAQFSGKALVRKVVVLRLPRHAASLPISFAVSCAAHRWAQIHIDSYGVFMEIMAGSRDFISLPGMSAQPAIQATINLNDKTSYSGITSGTLVSASGKVVLARDAAHARLASLIAEGKQLPAWARAYPVFYASPTETPEDRACGSLGPTTSKRMDNYVEAFLQRGIFSLMIGKGERKGEVARACKEHDGFYFAAIGGAAALIAEQHVIQSEIIDWPELGMEAVRLVTLKDLPLLCVIDRTGKDFYANLGSSI